MIKQSKCLKKLLDNLKAAVSVRQCQNVMFSILTHPPYYPHLGLLEWP